ncbi:MAG TPA: metallophosphoesterase [Trueperaceae bacterium]
MPPRSALFVVTLLLSIGAIAAGQSVPDPPRGDLRFAVFGDFNGSYGALDYPPPVEKAMRAIARSWRPDLLLSAGDVVAGQNKSLPESRYADMWRVFDREIAAPLRAAGIPYAFAMGNHDASSLRGPAGEFVFQRDRRAALDYWTQPLYESNLLYVERERFPFDYAFRAGPAFVVILDASSATVSVDQRQWLRRVLALPTARVAGLRVVVGHLPLVPVSVGRDRPGEVLEHPEVLLRILEEGGVDLYVSGHHAAYYPGRLGEVELLFSGGVGARRLLAGDEPARSTVTLVDVWWEPLRITYSTFDLATMLPIRPSSLPPVIVTDEGAVRLSERAHPATVETAQR